MTAQVGEGTLLVTAVPGLPALSHEEPEPRWNWYGMVVVRGGSGCEGGERIPSSNVPELDKVAPLSREEAALPLAQGGNVAQCNPFTATIWPPLGMGKIG